MDRKIRVLGIAPYEGLKYLMNTIQKENEDIELDVFLGDLEIGVSIALEQMTEGYDMILSRGGTFQLISQAVSSIPVIEIPLSIYDILRSIRIADGLNQSYAIMGFPSITSSAHQLCDLMNYPYEIYTIQDSSEIADCIISIKENGHELILCDRISGNYAAKSGLNTILITSGTESVQTAFNECRKVYNMEQHFYKKTAFLEMLHHKAPYETLVFDEWNHLCFSTFNTKQDALFLPFVEKQITKTKANSSLKTMTHIDGFQLSLEGSIRVVGQTTYTVFYLLINSLPSQSVRKGIYFSNAEEAADKFFQSFYGITNTQTDISHAISQYTKSTLPILITGESGTGKDEMAYTLFVHGRQQNHVFVQIDCALVDERSWNYLFTHTTSPFQDNNNTIYIKNMHVLTDTQYKQLYAYIKDSNLSSRNRLLISHTIDCSDSLSSNGHHFINHLSALVLSLRPLRENRENIPTLISLYISHLNDALGKEIVGFDPRAMELMQNYNWPMNYLQLKRILTALATITTTPYIRSSAVEDVFTTENGLTHPIGQSTVNFNISYSTKTLAELNHEIALSALKQNNDNHTNTAASLGISRTTLWRMLKNS